ncbi:MULTISPECIES: acetyl-CoA carboxylase biotin carboxylase subunit [unclassified Granulicatella]|uniref:acetyl-CoA carboxylase biotin carboxylase subunit n=1 Tax=unclassified Granulicatella TaxID=2630493 RepID=UPI0010740282|nr:MULTISPECIES: acetyl-CoA carboxylase biotin carboxylase subunit [unclassified Granulicatella]MBF0780896.1 acetyl-CoA carboxylase biotin carboxylase subunit [Granulicatella sp. 19428wC4_WM01]TFU93247.1 acetyl-CoA carboxylase biotin carboxylase subunit [Granulicatella sp. WM01]
MFKKILIANRGEIAVRIIRACQEMGIKTVAIYSTADKDALHVLLADEAICIGQARANESYLNKFTILSAAISTGACAIHAGFGFLSENAEFAKMCDEHGITFIGPHYSIIERMGNKSNARQAMIEAKVPVIPGSSVLYTEEEAIQWAEKLGYPIILKAVSGGGGKGMRKVECKNDMSSAFKMVQAEAKASFDDERIYMEKIITSARHIEFQILADQHGNVIHLGERDCSLQRNHQKVIEEAPSVYLDDNLRCEMGKIAVQAAKYVGYQNAGTIEFLVDKNKQFYFMEMNTRIQVEHPITEMIVGLDLIKWQIKIANNDILDIKQDDISLNGHAIECRINAEDPKKQFAPSTGKISFAHFPSGYGVRIESAVYNGYTIPPFYDSMIAKLIVHAPTRQEAFMKMKRALNELTITGIQSNIHFQEQLIRDSAIQKGEYTTDYLHHSFLPRYFEDRKE